MHPQLSSARLYIAQQRSTAQCGAVPCPSFCGAVSCGAMGSSEHTAVIQIPGVCTFFVYSSFCFLQLIVLSRSTCPPPPSKYRTYYCGSERDINKHTTQHKAISPAQAPLGIISIRYSHQTITGLFFLPHLFTCFS